MRKSGRTTRAVEAFKKLLDEGSDPVFIAANNIEVERIKKLIGKRCRAWSVQSDHFNRDTGGVIGFGHGTPYVFDHYACENIADDIEDQIKKLRVTQHRYRELANKF